MVFTPFNPPDFDAEKALIEKLFRYTNDDDDVTPYTKQLQETANRQRETIEIHLDDIERIIDDNFVTRIEEHVLRYISLFCDVIDKLMPNPTLEIQDLTRTDVYMTSRLNQDNTNTEIGNDKRHTLPKDLTRRYDLLFIPRSISKPLTIRKVSARYIGKLITVNGMVTRVTNVKPLLTVGTYTCDACGHEFYKPIRSREFMPMLSCENPNCVSSEMVQMQTRGSRFLKYQQVTIQESPDQVPVGSIPRSMLINLRNSSVRKCSAGDYISVSGVFLPMQLSGFRQLRAGLTSGTAFEGMLLHKTIQNVDSKEKNVVLEKIKEMSKDSDCFSKLSRSIAPEIYGLEDIKKALLLLMVGGVSKHLTDGVNIRGDINILLMGDPGVAKSQLLKHISVIAPRAVYTTGKGSTGVGLTAAVVRDSTTEELVLEGGALVMADMGICCIDEFDKMEEADRSAIHEVMEQQSVSISKAGICTTLNARTAILAAANPAYGRYDKKKSPEANIVLPAALMSRFDLMFVLVDSPNRDKDTDLAQHICYVHQHKKHPVLDFEPVSSSFLRAYIKMARSYEPTIPRHLTQNIVGTYVQIRAEGRENDAKRLLATPRTLLSILRLSQALARLRFSNQVEEEDIAEATRLMHQAQSSIRNDDEEERSQHDSMTQIFSFVKEFMQTRNIKSAKLVDIVNSLKIKGFNIQTINETLEHYQNLDVWMINQTKTKLTLV